MTRSGPRGGPRISTAPLDGVKVRHAPVGRTGHLRGQVPHRQPAGGARTSGMTMRRWLLEHLDRTRVHNHANRPAVERRRGFGPTDGSIHAGARFGSDLEPNSRGVSLRMAVVNTYRGLDPRRRRGLAAEASSPCTRAPSCRPASGRRELSRSEQERTPQHRSNRLRLAVDRHNVRTSGFSRNPGPLGRSRCSSRLPMNRTRGCGITVLGAMIGQVIREGNTKQAEAPASNTIGKVRASRRRLSPSNLHTQGRRAASIISPRKNLITWIPPAMSTTTRGMPTAVDSTSGSLSLIRPHSGRSRDAPSHRGVGELSRLG